MWASNVQIHQLDDSIELEVSTLALSTLDIFQECKDNLFLKLGKVGIVLQSGSKTIMWGYPRVADRGP